MIFPFCHLPSHNRPSVNILEIVQSKKNITFCTFLRFVIQQDFFQNIKVQQNQISYSLDYLF